MELTPREKAVALIANGIAVYSLYLESDRLPEGTTLFDFVLKAVPEQAKPEITADLIDAVFGYVSSAHGS